MRRVEFKVTGVVQGVFFRQEAKRVADGLDLTGWVRNEPDGSVKIVAEGAEDKLQELAEWCKNGTTWAKVEKVEAEWQEAGEEFNDFEIR